MKVSQKETLGLKEEVFSLELQLQKLGFEEKQMKETCGKLNGQLVRQRQEIEELSEEMKLLKSRTQSQDLTEFKEKSLQRNVDLLKKELEERNQKINELNQENKSKQDELFLLMSKVKDLQ